MALLLLLVVTLSTLSRTAVDQTNNKLQTAIAQQNALLSVDIAIGQLQKYAGADQRVTVTAEFGNTTTTGLPQGFSARPSSITASAGLVTTPQVGTKYWTAVLGLNGGNPLNIYNSTASATPVLVNWLVSGNENTPLIQAGQYGQMGTGSQTLPAQNTTFTPSQTVQQLNNLNVSPYSYNITINGQRAALLVGANTTGNNSIANYIIAPVVNITVPQITTSGVSTANSGSYAFWVGDESVKAKYNLADPFKSQVDVTLTSMDSSFNASQGAEARYRLTPQRFGIENMGNLSNYPVNEPNLKNVSTLLQAHYVGPKINDTLQTDPIRQHFHDLTTSSSGLLTDALRGGLRYDLNTAFEQQAVYNDSQYGLKGKLLISDGTGTSIGNLTNSKTSSDPAGPHVSPSKGPYWDTIKSYYDLANSSTQGGTSTAQGVAVRPGNSTTMGISPVVIQGRLQFGFLEANLGVQGSGANATLQAHAYFAVYAAFVLGNPYNFPITAPKGLDLSYRINTDTKSEWGESLWQRDGARGPGGLTRYDIPFPRKDNINIENWIGATTAANNGGGNVFQHYFPVLKNNRPQPGGFGPDSDRSMLDNVAFHIDAQNFVLQPGEAKVFSLGGTSAPIPADVTSGLPLKVAFSNTNVQTVTWSGTLGNRTQPVSLVPGFNINTFYLVDTGTDLYPVSYNVTTPTNSGVIRGQASGMSPSVSCTLELRTGGSDLGTNVIQSLSNLDLTGMPSEDGAPYTPPINPIRFIKNIFETTPNNGGNSLSGLNLSSVFHTPSPRFIASYKFFLPLADAPDWTQHASNFVTEEAKYTHIYDLANFVNYRTYADYNLRSTNFALHPSLPLNVPFPVFGVNGPATPAPIPGAMPTVPPYVRYFDSGGPDDDAANQPLENLDFSKNLGSGLWGYAVGPTTAGQGGQKNVILYNLPSRLSPSDSPIISLGQLQSADVTADDIYNSVSYQPGNAVGNSWFSPYVKRAESVSNLPNKSGNQTTDAVPPVTASTIKSYDISYLVNTALFDHFYFSSIPQTTAGLSGNASPKPGNQRMIYGAGVTPPTADQLGIGKSSATVKDPVTNLLMPTALAPARYLTVDGAFNVNSTSLDAWKALFASLKGIPVNTTDSQVGAPFPRIAKSPAFAGSSVNSAFTSANSNDGVDQPSSYAGYRRLSDADISLLANEMVKQVRARGPFMSLAQFVNRKLDSNSSNPQDQASLKGALQSAIDIANLNQLTGQKSMGTANISVTNYSKFYANQISGTSYTTLADSPGNRLTGIPGWLTQADVLQAIAPVITTRGDTFTVRAYGESDDPTTGLPLSRIWCEAIVQRLPDYVDPSNSPAVSFDGLTPTNKLFGRKFRVVSFRWLQPTDI